MDIIRKIKDGFSKSTSDVSEKLSKKYREKVGQDLLAKDADLKRFKEELDAREKAVSEREGAISKYYLIPKKYIQIPINIFLAMCAISLLIIVVQERKVSEVNSKPAPMAPETESSDRTREIVWVDRGKASIRSKLKDPSSAEFQGVFFNRGSDGIPVTCGQVNSKNSLGAYTGYQRFISAGKSSLSYLEEEVSDFSNIWSKLCT